MITSINTIFPKRLQNISKVILFVDISGKMAVPKKSIQLCDEKDEFDEAESKFIV